MPDTVKTAALVDADTGKTAEAPLAPANPAPAEVASVPVAEPTNEKPPSIAKGDLSSKVDDDDDDAADTLGQPSEKKPTDQSSPKPVSVEEVKDQEVAPTAAASDATATTQSDKASAETGDKRKVDEVAEEAEAEAEKSNANNNKPTPNGTAPEAAGDDDDEPAEKKQKSNGGGASTTNGTAPAPAPAPKKPGRPPKKDKKASAPVGRTLRKTRSQGAADVVQ